MLLLLRLRYSFRYSIAAAGSAPLQPSDTTPLLTAPRQVRYSSAPFRYSFRYKPRYKPRYRRAFLSYSRGLQMMVEPRPNYISTCPTSHALAGALSETQDIYYYLQLRSEVSELRPEVERCLARRDELQQKIDAWYSETWRCSDFFHALCWRTCAPL